MGNELTRSKVQEALDWAYDKAVNGVPGLGTAEELAASYLDGPGTLEQKADRLIRWQNAKCATSGFLTGLGGVLTLPMAIPANLATVWYVQLRMIAAIAHMGGHDLRDDRVRTMAYVCLTGTAATDVMKETGIKLGTKLTVSAINKIPKSLIGHINRIVGFKLVTKFGQKGIINLGRFVPIVGGLVGAAFDGVTTNVIGNVAKQAFLSGDEASGGEPVAQRA